MRLWTIQGIAIYEQLQREGVAYCTKPVMGDEPIFVRAYHWMAEQMRKRIGEPPIKGIEYPMWAWYQYNSAKDKKPRRSPKDMIEGMNIYMEIEVESGNGSYCYGLFGHCKGYVRNLNIEYSSIRFFKSKF